MKATLRPDQVTALQAWLDAAQATMRLTHWELVAKAEPPGENGSDDDAYAGGFIHDNDDHIDVMLGDAFWKETPEQRRVTLAHELLHCHFQRHRVFTRDRLRPRDREHASSLQEVAINQVSRIVAPLLPLPEVPD